MSYLLNDFLRFQIKSTASNFSGVVIMKPTTYSRTRRKLSLWRGQNSQDANLLIWNLEKKLPKKLGIRDFIDSLINGESEKNIIIKKNLENDLGYYHFYQFFSTYYLPSKKKSECQFPELVDFRFWPWKITFLAFFQNFWF